MNKPGGAAWILLVHQHPADPAAGIEASVYYDVKYVLHGNSDLSVHCSFVKPVLELSRGSRKRGLEPGPPPVSAPTPARGGQAQSHKRKIAVLKSLHMETEVCTKHMSVRSAELHRGPSVLGSSSSSEGTVEKPRVAVALDHSTLSKKNRNQRGQSAQRKEREQEQGREKYPPSSASTTASQREWSVCISHTSLENADVLKLDKFIQKFSNSLRDQSCPSSSSSTSSSTLHPISSLSPRDVCTKRPSSCTLTDIFDSNITHLIVSVDKKRLLRKRTLKFMQAIMGTLLFRFTTPLLV